jgi:hypothetical protein
MRSPSVGGGLFNPADGDSLSRSISNAVTLTRSAAISWTITDSTGQVVRTAMASESHAAGLVSWDWDGKDDAGAYVPLGRYWSLVTAATEIGAYSHKLPIQAMPFRVTTGNKAVRGRTQKFVIQAAEAQNGWPKLTVKQTGLKPYTVSLLKSSSTNFKVIFKVKWGGSPGTFTITLKGTDVNGGIDTQTFSLKLL